MDNTPVIVVGQATTALSVQRLVARLGYPVYAACTPNAWASKTRHYRPLPAVNGRRWEGEVDVAAYEYLRRSAFERAILIPASDDAALWLSKIPADLRDRFPVSQSSTETLTLLQNKKEFAALTDRLGVPSPRSYFIASSSDLKQLPFGEGNRLFFKPFDSQSFSRKFDAKAIRISNCDEAIETWETMGLKDVGAMVQEYVPGGPDRHYFIDGFRDRDGEFCAKLARQRIRIYPPDFGNSSLCSSIAFDEVAPAWDALEKLLREVRYRGIFSAEFKKDPNDGSFKVLEVNTRPWVYIEFADVCGVNFCEMYIQDALGLPVVVRSGYKVNKTCIDLYADYRAIRDADRGARPGIMSTLMAWFRSFKTVFSWSDPGPAVYFFVNRLRSKLGR